MKRFHALEFEDLPWFPEWLRGCMTNVLVELVRTIGADRVIGHQVQRALTRCGASNIVDMGSGSGGAMPGIVRALRAEGHDCTLTMTDLYPNPDIVRRVNEAGEEGVRYEAQPVDATALAEAPAGLKTMINSFHHMPPEKARAILASAVAHRQPLFLYELADNRMPNALWWLSLPIGLPLTALFCMILTLRVRPLTLQQIVFTYLIPLIPMFYAWDGQASVVRIYTFDDLRELLADIPGAEDGYSWEMGAAEGADGKKLGIYVFGCPVAA